MKRPWMLAVLVPVLLGLLGALAPYGRSHALPGHIVTVPMRLDHNRVYVEAVLTGPTGRSRAVRLWVDTGSQGLTLPVSLARELDMPVTSAPAAPKVLIGGAELDTQGVQAIIAADDVLLFEGAPADAMLGRAILARYTVVFDYPRREFSLLAAGSSTRRGVAVDLAVKPERYPTLAVVIDGQRYDMLLDTGASYTMFAEGITRELSRLHPDWAVAVGAVGSANMGVPPQFIDETRLLMLQLPQLGLGPASLQHVGVVTRTDGTWERFSNATAVPVVGALAGNALRHFRLEVDYQAHKAYFAHAASVRPDQMTLAGLILRARTDGSWFIQGISDKQLVPPGYVVAQGDQLLSVNGTEVAGLTWGQVTDALRGRAGDVKTLLLDRRGERVTVRLPVTPILP